mmetsp:Transcript_8284/g.15424  ORF Transcript_8284/g.15424 Transcript_8284/m.15424 type:complete len:298 (+) Transcript_8284:1644-2537(+)
MLIGILGLAALGILLLLMTNATRKKKRKDVPCSAPGDNQRPRRGMRNRRIGRQHEQDFGQEQHEQTALAEEQEEEQDDGQESDDDDEPNYANMTEKQMRKATRKQEKRERKEQMAEYIRAQEARKENLKLKYEERERLKEDERLEREEKLKEERERKEKEDEKVYNTWKDQISVETSGDGVISEDDKERQTQEFIEFVKRHKVVLIEDLSSNFGMRTQETIDRLEALEAEGRITGVLDDRGKFIYISTSEMEQVAEYIKKKGRVSISTVAKESNKLVDLTPVPIIEKVVEEEDDAKI